jgi:hypothetical protein
MRGDERWGGYGEPEELRAVLREWTVPGAPASVAARLRQTFMRRRAARRRRILAAAAASLLAAALWRGLMRPVPVTPRVVSGPTAPTTAGAGVAPPAPFPAPAPTIPSTMATMATTPVAEPARLAARRAATAHPSAEPAILVEPGQAERLVRLAGRLRDARLELGEGPLDAGTSSLEIGAIDVGSIGPVRVPEPPVIVVSPIPFREEPQETDVSSTHNKPGGDA